MKDLLWNERLLVNNLLDVLGACERPHIRPVGNGQGMNVTGEKRRKSLRLRHFWLEGKRRGNQLDMKMEVS